ncbi:MAG: response regulator [Candidatus Marinimicrobia bacterium]|nr:response regulator [Candidatus Neomarinimicrobiota bacterium]
MGKLLDFFQKKVINKDDEVFKGIRSQIFLFTALFLVLFGFGSTIINILFTVNNYAYIETSIFVVVFFVLVAGVFGKNLSFSLRVSLIILFLYMNGVMIISKWGLHSSGHFFLFLIPMIAAILNIRSIMTFFLVMNALTFIYLRILVNMEIINHPDIVKFSLNDWVVFSVGFILVNSFISLFVYYLIDLLVEKSDTNETEIKALSHDLEKLNRINLKFQSIIDEKSTFDNQEFQTQKMDSVARLTNGIAHEFNNFITVIVGYADILISISNHDETVVNLLKKIKSAGKAAEKLVGKLLAFSKNLVLKNKIVNVNDSLLFLKDKLLEKVKENVKVSIDLPEENYLIKIDPEQLENLIMELVINSDHALPSGGEIKIKIGTVLLNAEYTKKHHLEQDGEYVTITVEDNGIGMDDHILAHVFEPFFSTKGSGEALGLGMSVIYGIVRQCNGDIEIFSNSGEGTKVVLYFLSQQEKLTFKKNEKIIPSDLKGRERILLVEDDKLVRSVIVEVLNNYGYKMLTSSNGIEGYEVFSQNKNDLDMIIADVIMPKMNGIELAEKIEKEHPATKILFMSGYSEQVNNLEDMGVNYIKKPFDPLELIKKIRYVLDNE